MGYASWGNGTKAGGFNLARVTNPAAADPLAPILDTEFPRETVNSFEIGVKSELSERTVRLNADVFDQQYHDFQLNTFTGIVFVVSSLPDVNSKGAEVSSTGSRPCPDSASPAAWSMQTHRPRTSVMRCICSPRIA